jgi:hypothetical protein
MTISLNRSSAALYDPILTKLLEGFTLVEGVGTFIAPIVNVPSRANRVLQFGKEHFAAGSYERAPGASIERVGLSVGERRISLAQEALGWDVPFEIAEDAENADQALDLRKIALQNTLLRLKQSHEVQVADVVTNPANYEANCVAELSGASTWEKATSDPEQDIDRAMDTIGEQIGIRPNKMVISADVYSALKRNKRIREWAARGVIITEAVLAQLFDIDEVKVARRPKLTGNQTSYIYKNTAILFYQPTAESKTLNADKTANYTTPASFYTYQKGNLMATPERVDEDRRVYKGDVIVERSVETVGLGDNGLIGSAFLWTKVLG